MNINQLSSCQYRILVIAYQLSPCRGSEYSVAWNYVTEMSKDHHLTVLYGCNRDHLGEFDPPEEYYEKLEHPENVTFIPVDPGFMGNFLNSLNRKRIFVYTFYFAYHCWHKRLYREIRNLLRRQSYDLIHYLGPIGYREPGYAWKLPLPYLWGPIGGLVNINPILLNQLTGPGKYKQLFRSVCNRLQQKFSLRIRSALRRCDVLLASTGETREILKTRMGVDAEYLPENGITDMFVTRIDPARFHSPELCLIWIGRIDAGKNLKLLLEALCKVPRSLDWRLDVIGGGGKKAVDLREFAIHAGIGDHIVWHGQIPRDDVATLLGSAHCHVISSCLEGNPTVIWEAMSHGIPTITLDHCGMHDTVCDKCGIKIPMRSYSQILDDMAAAVVKVGTDREFLISLANGAVECGCKYTWDKRREFFNRQYEKTIARFQQKNHVTGL